MRELFPPSVLLGHKDTGETMLLLYPPTVDNNTLKQGIYEQYPPEMLLKFKEIAEIALKGVL